MDKIRGGYVLLPRAFDQSEISKFPPHTREIFQYFIRMANHQDTPGKKLKRGQLLTSYNQIISDLSWYVGYRKMSYKQHHCETAMKQLTKHAMITTTKTTRGTIVTICNYDIYQSPANYESHTESHNETENENVTKPVTIDKNVRSNNDNKDKGSKLSLTQREQNFYDELKVYYPKYPQETLRAFYDYWTEPNRSKTKLRFELEKTWSTSRRLGTWARREKPPSHQAQKPVSYSHIKQYDPNEEENLKEIEEAIKNVKNL